MKKAEMMRLALIDSIGHWEDNVRDLKKYIGKDRNPSHIINWFSDACACCLFAYYFTGISGDKRCVDSCIIGINFEHCNKTPWRDFAMYAFENDIDKKMISLAKKIPNFLKRLYFNVYGEEN